MKKILLLAVLVQLGMSSCDSKSSADIKVEDIKDACGCSDALKIISGEIITIAEDFNKDFKKIRENEDAYQIFVDTKKKLGEVKTYCRKELDIKESDLKECDSFEEVDKNMNIIVGISGWTEREIKDFMESCENMKYENERCNCLLEKCTSEFSTFDEMQNNIEKMAEILTDPSCFF